MIGKAVTPDFQQRLSLGARHMATFLTFEEMKEKLNKASARLVLGYSLSESDVRAFWIEAIEVKKDYELNGYPEF